MVRGRLVTPPQGGIAPALPNFGGSFLFMHTPFVGQRVYAQIERNPQILSQIYPVRMPVPQSPNFNTIIGIEP